MGGRSILRSIEDDQKRYVSHNDRDITISSVFPNKDKVRLFLRKKLYGSVQNQISLYLADGEKVV